MSRLLTRVLVAPIAVAAVGLSLSGCGGSSTSTTASSASSAVSSASSAASSVASSASASASATAAAGSLAAACPQIDALMGGSPDADPVGTAQQLEDIKVEVTTPDADLIEALAAAYTAIAADPTATEALTNSATALGAACQSATTAPVPN